MLGSEIIHPYHKGSAVPGGWWILDEPEVHLGPEVVVPDLAGWRRENLPGLPDTAWFEIESDWVCEMLSLATYKTSRYRKMPLYARHDVSHLRLVDPETRTLEAYRLQNGQTPSLTRSAWRSSLSTPSPSNWAPCGQIRSQGQNQLRTPLSIAGSS